MEYRLLGECVETVIDHRGLTPKKLQGDWSQVGYRAISAKNIKNGMLVNEGSMKRVDSVLYKRWMTEEIERGSIFITSEAPFGEVLYWDSDEKLVLSQRVFGLKARSSICDARYLYYWMRDVRREPLLQASVNQSYSSVPLPYRTLKFKRRWHARFRLLIERLLLTIV